MAPTVIRVMSVAGKSRDSTAALNPRLDAEKSGMASIFNIQTQRLENVFRSDHLYAETSLRCGGVPLPSPKTIALHSLHVSRETEICEATTHRSPMASRTSD